MLRLRGDRGWSSSRSFASPFAWLAVLLFAAVIQTCALPVLAGSASPDTGDSSTAASEIELAAEHAQEGNASQAALEDRADDREDAAQDHSDELDDEAAGMSPLDSRPWQETRSDLYWDSERNLSATVTTVASAAVKSLFLRLERDTTFARDPRTSEAAESTALSASTNLSEQLEIGGGFGTARTWAFSEPVGSLQASASIGQATIDAGFYHNLLAVSARAIKYKVRQTGMRLTADYDLFANLSSPLELDYAHYSDRNKSIDLEFSPEYTLELPGSQLALGYHFAYQSFAADLDHGYWAPRRLLANQASAGWAFDWAEYFGKLGAAIGPESARQDNQQTGYPSGGFGVSAAAALGWHPSAGPLIQCYWTTDRSPGWISTTSGLSLGYTF